MIYVIDVWDAHSFDAEVLEVLNTHDKQIINYFETDLAIFLSYDNARGVERPLRRPDNPYADSYYRLLDKVSELMASRTIRAFHYTRLTDCEVKNLCLAGISLSSKETLRKRLQALVSSNLLSLETSTHLYEKSPFHSDQHDARAGKFWMVSHPIVVDNSGVAPLMAYWGGEVASFFVNEPALLKQLEQLGMARILELAVPLVATCHSYAASKAVVATFGRLRGAVSEKSTFDLYVNIPLPRAAVIAIHSEKEAAFSGMGRSYPLGYCDVDLGRWRKLTGQDD
jgi:hypothetical protein